MMGWTMPDQREKFTVAEMVEQFTFDRISLGGPVFDLQKLTWLNGLYLRELSTADYRARLRAHLLGDAYLDRVIPLCKERVDKLEDFVSYGEYFFTGKVTPKVEDMLPKGKTAPELKRAFDALLEVFDGLFKWDHQTLDAELRKLCEKIGWKPKELFMPVRVAMTGKTATPGLFETMEVLGKECCRTRLRDAITLLAAAPAA
jgi:glutamyl-tRNA synthetase